jgi:2-octaprenyl-6-methoxyphenol hydroxylase
MQAAIDEALTRTDIEVRFGAAATSVTGNPAYVSVALASDASAPLQARLAVVADGAGATVAGIGREQRDYGQVALIAKVVMEGPHRGVAFERFTPRARWRCCPRRSLWTGGR